MGHAVVPAIKASSVALQTRRKEQCYTVGLRIVISRNGVEIFKTIERVNLILVDRRVELCNYVFSTFYNRKGTHVK